MVRRGPRRKHALIIAATALGALEGGCAFVFPDYALEGEGAGGAGGGAGGAAKTDGGGTSSATLAPDGARCSDGSECASGACVPSEEGDVCCATACSDDGLATCGANGLCEPNGAACAIYPEGTACDGAAVCSSATLTVQRCVEGACTPVDERCAKGLECEDATKCKSECVNFLDCAAPNAQCVNGGCTVGDGEVCTDDTQCVSGICGTNGTGHCCANGTSCVTGGPCGAEDCDAQGECAYPLETAVCSATQSCDGILLAANYCDGAGACESVPEEQPCPGGYACDVLGDACLETCGSDDPAGDALCAPGFWCSGAACEEDLAPLFPCDRPSQCASGACVPLLGFLAKVCSF